MSLIPEYILQQVLVQGIQQLRQNRSLLDVLFRNIHQDDLQQIWQFVRDNTIDIGINYPDDSLKVPSLTIILRNETESDEFLSDVMQPATAAAVSAPFLVGGTKGSVTPVTQASQRVLMSALEATGGSANTITASRLDMPLYDPFQEEAWAILVEGTGAGQRRKVLSVTPVIGADTIIEVSPVWDTIPDDTTVFKVVGQAPTITGEPSKVFNAGDLVERIGAHYQAQYQIMITAQAPELVVYLYMICKAIMFMNSSFLLGNGFMNLRMSGTDYLPKSEYLPTNAYQRSLMLDFTYSFDVYRLSDSVMVKDIQSIGITVHDPDVQDVNDPERIVFETQLDLEE